MLLDTGLFFDLHSQPKSPAPTLPSQDSPHWRLVGMSTLREKCSRNEKALASWLPSTFHLVVLRGINKQR